MSDSVNPIIRFEDVTKSFPHNPAVLENINLSIMPGEFVSVIGASGAGKSTFLKLIYAEEAATMGEVYFNERALSLINRKHLPYYRRNIGTVFQDFKLLPQKTAFENVAYALEVDGVSTEDIEEQVPEILAIVGLSEKGDKFPHQLSGGEQQRVALARALIHRPKIIIADEPTGNLDPRSTEEIIHLLLEINSYGTTVLLATHNRHVVDEIGKRVIVLDDGMIISDQVAGKYVEAKRQDKPTKTF